MERGAAHIQGCNPRRRRDERADWSGPTHSVNEEGFPRARGTCEKDIATGSHGGEQPALLRSQAVIMQGVGHMRQEARMAAGKQKREQMFTEKHHARKLNTTAFGHMV